MSERLVARMGLFYRVVVVVVVVKGGGGGLVL